MTEIYLERGEKWYVVMASGHATGREDVCAAISALLETLETWLEMSEVEVLEKRKEPGDVLFSYSTGFGNVNEWVRGLAVYDFLFAGFLRLEATAPEAVHVTVRDLVTDTLGENA